MSTQLSIIMPIHDLAKRFESLQRTIRSGVPQNFELVLVVDSNNEKDFETVCKLVTDADIDNFRIIRGEFGNPGTARNVGLDLAASPWITFLDSDDSIDFKILTSMLLNEVDSNKTLIVGQMLIDNQRDNSRKILDLDHSFLMGQSLALDSGFTRLIYSKVLLREVRFPPIRIAEDLCFLLRVLLLEPTFVYKPYVFYGYRIGRVDQSVNNVKVFHDFSKALKIMYQHFSENRGSGRSISGIFFLRCFLSYLKRDKSAFRFSSLRWIFKVLRVISCRPILSSKALLSVLLKRSYINE